MAKKPPTPSPSHTPNTSPNPFSLISISPSPPEITGLPVQEGWQEEKPKKKKKEKKPTDNSTMLNAMQLNSSDIQRNQEMAVNIEDAE